VVHTEQLQQVIDYIRKNNIIVWNVDPFVHTHYVDENSNVEIAVVMQCFGKIAEETGCAISLVHHTTKGAGGEGEMDRARGASAFGGAVRIMGTVMTMAEEDAPRWGIAPADHKMYFRLDDAKSNMTAPSSKVRWFQKVSEVLMPSGDSVGTIVKVDLTPVISEVDDSVLELVFQHAEKFIGPPSTRDKVYPALAKVDEMGVMPKGKPEVAWQNLKASLASGPRTSGPFEVSMVPRDGFWLLYVRRIDAFLE
jgi:RecA-family ATPase